MIQDIWLRLAAKDQIQAPRLLEEGRIQPAPVSYHPSPLFIKWCLGVGRRIFSFSPMSLSLCCVFWREQDIFDDREGVFCVLFLNTVLFGCDQSEQAKVLGILVPIL